MSQQLRRISDLELEQFLLEELPVGKMNAIHDRLREDKELQERLAAIKLSNEQILERYPVNDVCQDIRLKHNEWQDKHFRRQRRQSKTIRWLAYGLPVLLVAVIGVNLQNDDLSVVTNLPTTLSLPGNGIRTKGLNPSLEIMQITQHQQRRLQSGDELQSGDVIQMSYQGVGRRYGIILSMDGNRNVTLHYPNEVGESIELKTGKTPLGFSYELDNAPAFEHFVFLTSDQMIDVEQVIQALQKNAANITATRANDLDVDSHIEQYWFFLKKSSS
ncbi:MAG: hypothetical protein OEZ58_02450 [Gammaproteobacteria bacterium]|nr:hypothetical protein [Gammaproteobacteria bacterium]